MCKPLSSLFTYASKFFKKHMCNTNPGTDNSHLHYRYIICMLIGASILITCSKWSERPEFTSYLSNAATMTSLLLGVVAIFYSFISNNEMSKNLGSISTISTEVKAVKTEIQGFVEITKGVNTKSNESAITISDASTILKTSLGSLQQTLDGIVAGNATMQQLLSELPTRGDIDSRFEDIKRAQGEKPPQEKTVSTDTLVSSKFIDNFLENSTVTQNLFVLACVEANMRNKDLSTRKFCNAVSLNTPATFIGFLSCMHAMTICKRRAGPLPIISTKILSIHPRLKEHTLNYIQHYIDSMPDEEEKSIWEEKLRKIQTELFT